MSGKSEINQDETNCKVEVSTEEPETGKDAQKSVEIDYLHPDGKPTGADEQVASVSVEESVQDLKSAEKSQAEVDGHHVCNDKCQTHHAVVAKGADKT